MPTPFYTAHPEALDVLRAEAQRWIGTPFRAASGACGPGGGVDCVRLAEVLQRTAGAIPPDTSFPRYRIDAGSHLDRSPLLDFLRGHGPAPDSPTVAACLQEFSRDEPVQPGDVAVLKMGRTPYHLAIVLSAEGDLVHVLLGRRVSYASLRDPTFANALQTVFRPVEKAIKN